MQLNYYGIITLLLYTIIPITMTYLLVKTFSKGKRIQRKGWKNWFLFTISLVAGILFAIIKSTHSLIFNARISTFPPSFIEFYLLPTALIVTATTLSLKASRYLSGILIPPMTILLTSLIPSSIEIMRTEQTYDGTLPMFMPLVVLVLLPITLTTAALANLIESKLNMHNEKHP